ncbi:uncharacterized protein LOC143279883 [Babylonia areolata]|uniref:uncharacterized protein LOC143279883 n=1 Tax=Babylonia areolata TaxID=304850 RepID=UPI003FD0B5BF
MADEKAIDPVPEKKWQTDRKWMKRDFYRGSHYPPFSIEPVPYERQRLTGCGMTAEDRALRKQWVLDQQLSPNEPRYVKEVTPRNFFRRLYMGPADSAFARLIPMIGRAPASMARVAVPRLMLIVGGVYWAYYHLKYNAKDWTRDGGFHIYVNKPAVLTTNKEVIEKKYDDFYDLGFKSRAVLLYSPPVVEEDSPETDSPTDVAATDVAATAVPATGVPATVTPAQ